MLNNNNNNNKLISYAILCIWYLNKFVIIKDLVNKFQDSVARIRETFINDFY